MKKPIFKSIIILSSVLALWSCSDEANDALTQAQQAIEDSASSESPEAPARHFQADQDYLIYTNTGIVTDANGNVVGTFVPSEDGVTGSIVTADGNVIAGNINTEELPITTLSELNPPAAPVSSDAAQQPPVPVSSDAAQQPPMPISSDAQQQPAVSSAAQQQPASSANVNPVASSSSTQQQQPKSSAAVSGNCDGKCLDSVSGKCVGKYDQLKGSKGEQYAYDNDCKLNCYYDPAGNNCKNISGAAPASSAAQQPKSSSSVKSSSSSAKSSSSVKSSSSSARSSSSAKSSSSYSQQITTNFKVKNGGRSGQGWGSRYWDCCMPHCAWSGNTSNPTRTCNAQMQNIGESGGSVCNGGSGGVCDIQAPWAASDNLAFAFAAVPAGLGGECGKCFLLTFDGNTHNGGSGANTSGLRGKQMVIMVSNIGGDVGSNQFDIMIPGGGVGKFNGCGAQLGINSTGAQYGGFITDCKSDPSCVKQKCSVFSKFPKLQAGCEFSATWMGGANNPSFKFEELESCPSEISSKW